MVFTRQSARRRALLPECDRLEPRELLSAIHTNHADPIAAIARHTTRPHHMPSDVRGFGIVPKLDPQPDASYTTVPPNGDVNPYGLAFVPTDFVRGGVIHPGDALVSNFNASSNLQGTGTTIVDIGPTGAQSVFYQGQPGLGLSTALGVLRNGFVIVGNVPATYDGNGNLLSVNQGSLIILDKNGNQVANLTDPALLDGPWDLTVNDQGSSAQVFVSNVLSGTVTRIDLDVPRSGDAIRVVSMVQIASGYTFRTDPAALVVGPTGLAYNPLTGTLYVASTGDNAIFAIHHASTTGADHGTGDLVYEDSTYLRGPLGLVLAPNGDLLTTNGDAVNPDPTQPSELIEFTPRGRFVGELSLDPAQGAAFGIALNWTGKRLVVATVNDDTNTLDERFVTY